MYSSANEFCSQKKSSEEVDSNFSFDDLEVLALGEIGLTYDYFYSLTPRVFNNITVGYYRKKDQAYKDQWEQTRQIVVSVMIPHLKKGTNRDSIMKFPWDKSTDETTTIEDINSINANEVLQAQQDFWARVDKMKKQN